jgi:hypothetical protein
MGRRPFRTRFTGLRSRPLVWITLNPNLAFPISPLSGVQINPNRDELRPKETYDGRISGAAAYLTGQPALARAGNIVGQHMCCAGVPPSPEPVAQFQAHTGITHSIENVSGLHPE